MLTFNPPHKRRYLAVALFNLLLCSNTYQALANETNTYELNISSRPVLSALTSLTASTGVQIINVSGEILQQSAPALSGSYTLEQALTVLLSGSNLQWQWVDAKTISIGTTAQESSTILLGPVQVMGDVVDGAKVPFDTFTEARSVSYVNRDQLDRVPQTTPSDMFDGITGVQMGNAAAQGSFDPNIRGMQGHGRVKVLLDGSDTTQASRVTYAGNRSHNYVDPDFVAGISVEKGPGLESGGLGGTISMRTFNAEDIITDPGRNSGIRVRGMLGNNSGDLNSTTVCTRIRTYNTGRVDTAVLEGVPLYWNRCVSGYVNELANYTNAYALAPYSNNADVPSTNASGSIVAAWQPNEVFEVLGGYAHRQSGNYSAGRHGKVDRSFANGSSYFYDGRVKTGFSFWEPGTEVYGTFTDTESFMAKARLSLGDHGLLFRYNYLENYYVQHANTSTQATLTPLDYYPPASDTRQQRYGVDYAWRPDSDWFNFKANLWAADTNETLYLGEMYASLTPQHIQTDTLGLDVNNTSMVPLFARELVLKVGGQYKRESINSDTEVDGLESTQYGLFVSAELPATDWLRLDAGLRYDDYEVNKDPDQYYRVAGDNSDNGTSLHAGVTWQPLEPLQVFARYAEGWRAPSSRENSLDNCNGGLVPYQNTPDGPISYQCLPGLMRPEQSENVEIGANLALDSVLTDGDRLGVKLVHFDNTYRDYIYGSGTSVLPTRNIDKARFVGYESSLAYDAGWFFADYAYTHNRTMEYCGTAYAPELTGECLESDGWGSLTSQYSPAKYRHNATLGIRLFERALTVGGKATVVSGTGYDYEGLDRYEVYDVFVSYTFRRFDFGLSAENVTDRYYFEAGTAPTWAIPAPGRTVRGTITARF